MNRHDIKNDLLFSKKAEGFKLFRVDGRIEDLIESFKTEDCSFPILKSRLISVINEVDDEVAQKALLAAFALDEEYADLRLLSLRRKQFAKSYNLSLDKLRIIEDAGINEMVKILMNRNNK